MGLSLYMVYIFFKGESHTHIIHLCFSMNLQGFLLLQKAIFWSQHLNFAKNRGTQDAMAVKGTLNPPQLG